MLLLTMDRDSYRKTQPVKVQTTTNCGMPRPHLRNLQESFTWGSENILEDGTERLQEAADKGVCGKLSSVYGKEVAPMKSQHYSYLNKGQRSDSAADM